MFHRFQRVNLPHQPGIQAQDHRRLPFAGVPHLRLTKRGGIGGSQVGEMPIRREEQQQIGTLTVALACLEHRLPARDVVPAVSIEEHDPSKSVHQSVLDHPPQKIQVGAGRGGNRSRKIQVMIRIPQPLQGCDDDPVLHGELHPAHDFTEQQAVGVHRQVMAVLFHGGHRKHPRRVLRQRRHLTPIHLGKLHVGGMSRERWQATRLRARHGAFANLRLAQAPG